MECAQWPLGPVCRPRAAARRCARCQRRRDRALHLRTDQGSDRRPAADLQRDHHRTGRERHRRHLQGPVCRRHAAADAGSHARSPQRELDDEVRRPPRRKRVHGRGRTDARTPDPAQVRTRLVLRPDEAADGHTLPDRTLQRPSARVRRQRQRTRHRHGHRLRRGQRSGDGHGPDQRRLLEIGRAQPGSPHRQRELHRGRQRGKRARERPRRERTADRIHG